MAHSTLYLYTSARLGFRNWSASDIDWLADLCSHPQVMQYFPRVLSRQESLATLQRLMALSEEHGYTYYAVEELQSKSPIGFIGIAYQDYLEEIPPWNDIGWRLHPDHWGMGLATEGAQATLDYASQVLQMTEVLAVAPIINKASIQVMKKIGMTKVKTFNHPKLDDCSKIEECVMYKIHI